MIVNKLILSFALITCCAGSVSAGDSDGSVIVMRPTRQTHLCEFPDFTSDSCEVHSSGSSSPSEIGVVYSPLRSCYTTNSLQARRGDLIITVMKSIFNPSHHLVHVINGTGGKSNYLFGTREEAIIYARNTYGV